VVSKFPTVAVLDANVLYPAPLRDFLLRLADEGFFNPHWSPEIQAEWTHNVLENRPELATQIARTSSMMDRAFPDASVTGYESLISSLTNDPKDRHVLAVAIKVKSPYIVTFNLKDFKSADLAPHGVESIPPDAFTLELYTNAPKDMVRVIRTHRSQLTRPPKTAEEYLETLAQNHLTQTVAALQKHLAEM
jgi:predicted nucleic acid-binding protein